MRRAQRFGRGQKFRLGRFEPQLRNGRAGEVKHTLRVERFSRCFSGLGRRCSVASLRLGVLSLQGLQRGFINSEFVRMQSLLMDRAVARSR